MFVYTIKDIIGVFLLIIIGIPVLIGIIRQSIKQYKCKHDKGVFETQSCYAICNNCGKNLGFIGIWRK